MERYQFFSVLLILYTYFVNTVNSQDTSKCILGNDAKESEKLMNEISFLVGHNYATEKDGYKYSIAICTDALKQNPFASVVQTKNQNTVVLGRRNDSHLIHGDSWMVLSYGSGDFKTEKKEPNQRLRASIYIVCCPKEHSNEPQIQLVEENDGNYKFILTTQDICNYDEGVSGMKVVLIIAAAIMSVYCFIGIIYKRIVHNAQRCQQIPNFDFWSKIGNSLADGCNYVCRCDHEPENSWNSITSNFESNDRDDALLRP